MIKLSLKISRRIIPSICLADVSRIRHKDTFYTTDTDGALFMRLLLLYNTGKQRLPDYYSISSENLRRRG